MISGQDPTTLQWTIQGDVFFILLIHIPDHLPRLWVFQPHKAYKQTPQCLVLCSDSESEINIADILQTFSKRQPGKWTQFSQYCRFPIKHEELIHVSA